VIKNNVSVFALRMLFPICLQESTLISQTVFSSAFFGEHAREFAYD
jgi:hypothetical protein